MLALLIAIYALMLRSLTPVGLPVHLLKVGVSDHDSGPIVISLIATNGGGRPLLYVNSKETLWDELAKTLRSQLKVRPRWIVYVAGETGCHGQTWRTRSTLPEGCTAEVVLLTVTPNVGSDDARETGDSKGSANKVSRRLKQGGKKIERAVTLVML